MNNFVISYLYQMRDRMTPHVRRMARQADQASKSMRGLGSSATNAIKGITGIGRSAMHAERRVNRLAYSMRSLRTIRLGMGGMMAGMGPGLIAHRVGGTLLDYEKSMNMVLANMVSHETEKGFVLKGFDTAKNSLEMMQKLREETQRIARVSIFEPTEVAGGLLELARAGVDAKGAMHLLHPSIRLAGAGALDVSSAVDIATNVAKSFNYDIEKTTKVVDALAMAASNANTDVRQLGQAMKYAAPSAFSSGRSMEETTAILMTLAKRGLNGSIGGTSVARMLESIYKRSGPAVKALRKIGLSHKDFLGADGKSIPIADIIDKFRIAAEKFGKEKVIMAIQAMMGSRGGRAAKLLFETGGAEEIRHNLRLLEIAKDRAKLMEKMMMSGVYGAYKKMTASIVEAIIKLGEGGLSDDLSYLADRVRDLANGFSALDPTTKKWIGRLLLAVTAISTLIIPLGIFMFALRALYPVMKLLLAPFIILSRTLGFFGRGALSAAGFIGNLLTKIPVLGRGFAALIVTLKLLGKAFRFALPLGWIITIGSLLMSILPESTVQGIIAKIVAIGDKLSEFWNSIKAAWEGSELQTAFNWISESLTKLWNMIPADNPVSNMFKDMNMWAEKVLNPIRTIREIFSEMNSWVNKQWDDFKNPKMGHVPTHSLAEVEATRRMYESSVDFKVTTQAPESITLKLPNGQIAGSIPLTTKVDKGRTEIDSALATP